MVISSPLIYVHPHCQIQMQVQSPNHQSFSESRLLFLSWPNTNKQLKSLDWGLIFWISYPFPLNLEELAHFKATSYSVALSLSAPRLEKKKLFVSFLWTKNELSCTMTKISGLFFWVMSMDLATELTGGWGRVCSAPGQGSNLVQNQLQRWEDFCR